MSIKQFSAASRDVSHYIIITLKDFTLRPLVRLFYCIIFTFLP